MEQIKKAAIKSLTDLLKYLLELGLKIPDYLNKEKILKEIEKLLDFLNLPKELLDILKNASLEKLIELFE